MHSRKNIKNSESSSSPKSRFYDSMLGISCFELKEKTKQEKSTGNKKITSSKKISKVIRPIAKRTSSSDTDEDIITPEGSERSFVLIQAHGVKTGRLGSESDNSPERSFVLVQAHGIHSFSSRCIPTSTVIDAVIQ